MEATQPIDYEYLAIRLGLKDFSGNPNKDEAKRTWQLWGECQDYRIDDHNGSEDQNMLLAFATASGLPTQVCERRIKVCKEIDAILNTEI